MRLLLDTHVAVWIVSKPGRIPDQVKSLIASADDHYVSIASFWEIGVKSATRRASNIPMTVGQAMVDFANAGFETLAIKVSHCETVESLRLDHGDPFDRLILAQAITEQLRLVTKDPKLARHDASIITW